jgi:hypothetical protein
LLLALSAVLEMYYSYCNVSARVNANFKLLNYFIFHVQFGQTLEHNICHICARMGAFEFDEIKQHRHQLPVLCDPRRRQCKECNPVS